MSSLTRKLKEAAEEEETCRRSVQKLEQDKARAAVAITREAAIKSEGGRHGAEEEVVGCDQGH